LFHVHSLVNSLSFSFTYLIACLLVNICVVDGYFSSSTTRYIFYENPTEDCVSKNACVSAQLADLSTALAIAVVLDRVLILPRFHCLKKSKVGLIDCPLNSLLKIRAFDAEFSERYRESSFLRNPLVPYSVRHSVSPQHSISDVSICRNKRNTLTIADNELRQTLDGDRHRVVSLSCLRNTRVTFKSEVQQNSFDKKIEKSFHHSDYRQLQ